MENGSPSLPTRATWEGTVRRGHGNRLLLPSHGPISQATLQNNLSKVRLRLQGEARPRSPSTTGPKEGRGQARVPHTWDPEQSDTSMQRGGAAVLATHQPVRFVFAGWNKGPRVGGKNFLLETREMGCRDPLYQELGAGGVRGGGRFVKLFTSIAFEKGKSKRPRLVWRKTFKNGLKWNLVRGISRGSSDRDVGKGVSFSLKSWRVVHQLGRPRRDGLAPGRSRLRMGLEGAGPGWGRSPPAGSCLPRDVERVGTGRGQRCMSEGVSFRQRGGGRLRR